MPGLPRSTAMERIQQLRLGMKFVLFAIAWGFFAAFFNFYIVLKFLVIVPGFLGVLNLLQAAYRVTGLRGKDHSRDAIASKVNTVNKANANPVSAKYLVIISLICALLYTLFVIIVGYLHY